jgi:hypothetical protein
MVGASVYRIMGNRIMANREILIASEATGRQTVKMAGGCHFGRRGAGERFTNGPFTPLPPLEGDGGRIANGVFSSK